MRQDKAASKIEARIEGVFRRYRNEIPIVITRGEKPIDDLFLVLCESVKRTCTWVEHQRLIGEAMGSMSDRFEFHESFVRLPDLDALGKARKPKKASRVRDTMRHGRARGARVGAS